MITSIPKMSVLVAIGDGPRGRKIGVVVEPKLIPSVAGKAPTPETLEVGPPPITEARLLNKPDPFRTMEA